MGHWTGSERSRHWGRGTTWYSRTDDGNTPEVVVEMHIAGVGKEGVARALAA